MSKRSEVKLKSCGDPGLSHEGVKGDLKLWRPVSHILKIADRLTLRQGGEML